MTTDEIRDELARLKGWTMEPSADQADPAWWRWNANPTLKSRTWCKGHPMPPTLDGANVAVPEGYDWEKRRCIVDGVWAYRWFADTDDETVGPVPDTGDPVHDLYALALACVRAEESPNGKA